MSYLIVDDAVILTGNGVLHGGAPAQKTLRQCKVIQVDHGLVGHLVTDKLQ